MINNIEKQKINSEIVKNYLAAIAIVIGGVWVLYNFHALRTAYTTHLDIASKEATLVALDFDLHVSVIESICEPQTGLEVIVMIENKGNLPVKLNLADSETGFGVSRIGQGFDENGNPDIIEFVPAKPYSFYFDGTWGDHSELVVLPGIKTSLTYFVTVEHGGYYLASFLSKIPPESLKLMVKHAKGESIKTPPDVSIWSAQKYFSVPERISKSECTKAGS